MYLKDAQEYDCEVAVIGDVSERILVQSVSLYQILGPNPAVKLVLCLTPDIVVFAVRVMKFFE